MSLQDLFLHLNVKMNGNSYFPAFGGTAFHHVPPESVYWRLDHVCTAKVELNTPVMTASFLFCFPLSLMKNEIKGSNCGGLTLKLEVMKNVGQPFCVHAFLNIHKKYLGKRQHV